MSTLTKTFRLVWDDDKKLLMDPYTEYAANSVTKTNTSSYFESDNIGEIENKIEELDLIYEEKQENIEEDI